MTRDKLAPSASLSPSEPTVTEAMVEQAGWYAFRNAPENGLTHNAAMAQSLTAQLASLSPSESVPLRCFVTGDVCSPDNEVADHPCACSACKKWRERSQPASEDVIRKLEAAHAEVCRIANYKSRDGGWRMSIPARPDYDSDLIIGRALQAAIAALRSPGGPEKASEGEPRAAAAQRLADSAAAWDGATEDGCLFCGGEPPEDDMGATFLLHTRDCPIVIHRLALIERLMDLDPLPDSPDGRRLSRIVATQEAYEKATVNLPGNTPAGSEGEST